MSFVILGEADPTLRVVLGTPEATVDQRVVLGKFIGPRGPMEGEYWRPWVSFTVRHDPDTRSGGTRTLYPLDKNKGVNGERLAHFGAGITYPNEGIQARAFWWAYNNLVPGLTPTHTHSDRYYWFKDMTGSPPYVPSEDRLILWFGHEIWTAWECVLPGATDYTLTWGHPNLTKYGGPEGERCNWDTSNIWTIPYKDTGYPLIAWLNANHSGWDGSQVYESQPTTEELATYGGHLNIPQGDWLIVAWDEDTQTGTNVLLEAEGEGQGSTWASEGIADDNPQRLQMLGFGTAIDVIRMTADAAPGTNQEVVLSVEYGAWIEWIYQWVWWDVDDWVEGVDPPMPDPLEDPYECWIWDFQAWHWCTGLWGHPETYIEWDFGFPPMPADL